MRPRKNSKLSTNYEISVLFLGDPKVGKTQLINRFVHASKNNFSNEHKPTVHGEHRKTITITGTKVNLRIIDTSGLDEYDTGRFDLYKGADVCVCVYSCEDPISFVRVKRKWGPEILERGDSGVPVVIVANKLDIKDDNISSKAQKRLVKATGGYAHFQLSAKNSTIREIHRLYEHAAKTGIQRKKKPNKFQNLWKKRKEKFLKQKKKDSERLRKFNEKRKKFIEKQKEKYDKKKKKNMKKSKSKKKKLLESIRSKKKKKKEEEDEWVVVGDDGNVEDKDTPLEEEEEELVKGNINFERISSIGDTDEDLLLFQSTTFDLSSESSDEEKEKKEDIKKKTMKKKKEIKTEEKEEEDIKKNNNKKTIKKIIKTEQHEEEREEEEVVVDADDDDRRKSEVGSCFIDLGDDDASEEEEDIKDDEDEDWEEDEEEDEGEEGGGNVSIFDFLDYPIDDSLKKN